MVNCKKDCSVVGLWLGGEWKPLPQLQVIKLYMYVYLIVLSLHYEYWMMLLCVITMNVSTLLMKECVILGCLQWDGLCECSHGWEGFADPCDYWYFHEYDVNYIVCMITCWVQLTVTVWFLLFDMLWISWIFVFLDWWKFVVNVVWGMLYQWILW